MRKRVLTISLTALALGGAPVLAAAQATPKPGGRLHGGPVTASRAPDDASIPAMEEVSPETTPRAFVESFIVSMINRDKGEVYDAYLDDSLQQGVPRDAFIHRMGEFDGVLGGLVRLGVLYLRQENARGDVPDHGYADYVLVFERDPRVNVRVEFERKQDRRWKVINYTMNSPQLDSYLRNRAAASAEEEKDTADGPPVP